MKKSGYALTALVIILAVTAAGVFYAPSLKDKFFDRNGQEQNGGQTDLPPQALEIAERTESRRITAEDGTELVGMDVSLPEVKGDSDAAQVINEYYERIYQKDLLVCEDELADMARDFYAEAKDSFTPFNFSQSFLIKTNNEKYIAVVRSTDQYTGGVHGNYIISCDNFDPKTGAKLSLADLFTADSEAYTEVIYSEIENQIEQHDFDEFYENYSEALRTDFNPEDFFVGETGITFVYQIYSLAPFAAGEQYFTVPFSAFGGMIKPEVAGFAAPAEADPAA